MDDRLDLQTTYRAILDAARQGKYVTYGTLVKASGARWQKARHKLNDQLGELMELAAQRNWPVPGAIVVDQTNLETGTLTDGALRGLVRAARELGFDVQDPLAFVKEQQQAVFDWAAEAPDKLELQDDKPETGGPKYVLYFGPVLEALRQLGGSARPKAVSDIVAKLAGVTAKELKEKNKNGRSKYENHVAWARFYLSKAGFIDGGIHGRWVLTAKGRETQLDQEGAAELFRDVSSRLRDEGDHEDDDTIAPPDDVAEDKASLDHPLNTVLYGPPGTGKTYATFQRCVGICDSTEDRKPPEAIHERYRKLVEEGRVEFVTFHQSYGYEEFVEGLRPETEGDGGGFRLKVRDGVLKRIAERARRVPESDVEGRQFYKVSLGWVHGRVFKECMEDGCVRFDWLNEQDWSDPRYDKEDFLFTRARGLVPDVTWRSLKMISASKFRCQINQGDIVVVPEGASKYWAVGEVVGDYEYDPVQVR